MSFSEIYNQVAHRVPIDDLKYFIAVVIIFYLLVIAFRFNGVYKKSECPKCDQPIKRSERKIIDRVLSIFFLGILPIRRYKCTACNWKGLRWNTQKSYYVKKRKKLGRRTGASSGNSNTI